MQMRSYERLIYNLTTVTGHFVEEKWRQSNEEIRKREKERKRRKEHTRENVCIRNEMHASKRITISRTKSYTKRFVEREPVQRITPCTENELRWNCETIPILSEQVNVNERIILQTSVSVNE